MQGRANPPARNDEPKWLGAEEARAALLGAIEPVQGWESTPVRDAFERVRARTVVAPFDVPAHDNSAMDGYAGRAADLRPDESTCLTAVGMVAAGSAFSGVVGRGQAVRVMTGALLPPGADTVVVQEIVQCGEDELIVPAGQRAGHNVRSAGEDLPPYPILRVPSATALHGDNARRQHLRGERFERYGSWQVRPALHQGSDVLRSTSVSNSFIVLPESGRDVAGGDLVEVQAFEGLP